jgi:hypothetical protein
MWWQPIVFRMCATSNQLSHHPYSHRTVNTQPSVKIWYTRSRIIPLLSHHPTPTGRSTLNRQSRYDTHVPGLSLWILYVEELWFRKYEYLNDEELWIMNVNVLCDDLHLSDIWIWKRFWASVWDIISKTKQAVSKGIILDRVYHILTDAQGSIMI